MGAAAVFQALRMAMTAAAESAGADADRASFTIALQTARDQVTAAQGVADCGDPGDTGRTGQHRHRQRRTVTQKLPRRY
jgi:hypothetical protein